ncbi:DNA methyltransferase [Loktanella sp. DJP18]|uniref:DNA methyltransferase n=1 Tax=Loktanella sp. DJP18 TaxID=3409788 RepID=UPI003BB610F4
MLDTPTDCLDNPFLKDGSHVSLDVRNYCDGRVLLGCVRDDAAAVVFFDPQYRGVMDKMKYGNEGQRQRRRFEMEQMPEEMIVSFFQDIDRVLRPSGHLFLWVDKFHLCEGISNWTMGTRLEIVDLLTWNKGKIGMGYRTRRKSEYLIILQKAPKRAKGVWTKHNIPDVVEEKISDRGHVHQKPVLLQTALLEATTNPGDLIIDPAAGSFSIMEAAHRLPGRHFLGSDLVKFGGGTPDPDDAASV